MDVIRPVSMNASDPPRFPLGYNAFSLMEWLQTSLELGKTLWTILARLQPTLVDAAAAVLCITHWICYEKGQSFCRSTLVLLTSFVSGYYGGITG